MSITGFVLRNAIRNKRRLLLTMLSVAVSIFLFVELLAILRALTNPEQSDDSAQRLISRHRVSLGNALPYRYYERIKRAPGVEAATPFSWFGGVYKDEKFSFPQFAIDPTTIFKILTESRVPPEQLKAFQAEKNACVVGKATMERFKWKLGEKVNLKGTFWGCDPELVVRGVYEGGVDESNLFFRHDYFDELMGRIGITGTYWIRLTPDADAATVIEKIDAMFRNSNAETKTETERAFMLDFVSMQGNIKTLIGSIASVIVFTMVLVTASTMSMSIRERAREIAILKAIGFNAPRLFGLVVSESVALAMIGGVVGCSGALWLAQVNLSGATNGAIPRLIVPTETLLSGLMLAFALGVAACIIPAITTIRATIVAGLRQLD